MAQWTNEKSANGSPIWGPALVNKAPNTSNRTALYGANTAGVFAVDASANTTGVTSHGWVLVKTGSGGRAGRVQKETLVATSPMVSPPSGNT